MREDEMNKIITEALRDAPPAPEALRHNVMEAVRELEYAPEKSKNRILKSAPALACVAVFVVAVIAARPMLIDNFSSSKQTNSVSDIMSMDNGGAADGDKIDTPMGVESAVTGGGPGLFSAPDTNAAPAENAVSGDDSEPEYAIASMQDSVIIKYIITGELPEELDGLEYTLNSDNSRIYENVPDEIIAILLANNAFIAETPVDGIGNTIKWIP